MVYTSFGIPIVTCRVYVYIPSPRDDDASARAHTWHNVYTYLSIAAHALRRRVPVKGIGMYTPYVYLSPGVLRVEFMYIYLHRVTTTRQHARILGITCIHTFLSPHTRVTTTRPRQRYRYVYPIRIPFTRCALGS